MNAIVCWVKSIWLCNRLIMKRLRLQWSGDCCSTRSPCFRTLSHRSFGILGPVDLCREYVFKWVLSFIGRRALVAKGLSQWQSKYIILFCIWYHLHVFIDLLTPNRASCQSLGKDLINLKILLESSWCCPQTWCSFKIQLLKRSLSCMQKMRMLFLRTLPPPSQDYLNWELHCLPSNLGINSGRGAITIQSKYLG